MLIAAICPVSKPYFNASHVYSQLVEEMRKKNPNIDYNIYKALDNVNLNCVIGTKKAGEYKSFLDDYED